VSVSVIQQATRMRPIMLTSVAPTSVQHLSTLYHKGYDFRKNVSGHKMCVLISYTTFFLNISYSKKISARDDKHVYIYTKIRPVGAELFHVGVRTDRQK
jgi:hypothetical protein